MNVYWKDYRGDDESLWKHEWDKHGTCISTLEPSCYSGYTRYEEMVDYFEKAVELFRGLNTYQVWVLIFLLMSSILVPCSRSTAWFQSSEPFRLIMSGEN